MDVALRDELLALAEAQQRDLAPLTRQGAARDWAALEAVHRHYADLLSDVFNRYGWPARSLIGEDGIEALWQLFRQAMWVPSVYRRGISLLKASPDADPREVAMLDDQIAVLEGQPQQYGTRRVDWDEHGRIHLLPVVDDVDERRAGIGLGPLDDVVNQTIAAMETEDDLAPPGIRARLATEQNAWARRTGWRR